MNISFPKNVVDFFTTQSLNTHFKDCGLLTNLTIPNSTIFVSVYAFYILVIFKMIELGLTKYVSVKYALKNY